MDKQKDGGPAFPFEGGLNNGYTPDSGMTLRDWFAGQALSGVVPNDHGGFKDWMWYANAAYHIADAMLAARQAKP